jgi:hypothetical protein
VKNGLRAAPGCYNGAMARHIYEEWEGREYDHEPKGADWYIALGIIALAGIAAAFLFADYLIAILVAAAALALALHAVKVPPVHRFRLVDDGLMIGEEFHPYASMESFCILEDEHDELPPLLSIKTTSWLSPHLVIPLKDVDAEGVYLHFLERVPEEAHPHTLPDLVAAWLGF